MTHHTRRLSHNLYLIDHATLEVMQQQNSYMPSTSRGTDYGTTTMIDLLQNHRSHQSKKVRMLRKRIVVDTKFKRFKARTVSKRKNSCTRKRRQSRLRKAIMRYRHRRLCTLSNCGVNSSAVLDDITEALRAMPLPSSASLPQVDCNAVATTDGNGVLHSRRFRSYCDNCTTPRLATHIDHLLRELNGYQKYKLSHGDSKLNRYLVIGIREVQSLMHARQLKMVIIAPDCEEIAGENGLDTIIGNIKKQCYTENIPCVFSLPRRQLAYALYKKVPVSCVGILNYDGAREIFTEVLSALQQAREFYATASRAFATEGKVINNNSNNKMVEFHSPVETHSRQTQK